MRGSRARSAWDRWPDRAGRRAGRTPAGAGAERGEGERIPIVAGIGRRARGDRIGGRRDRRIESEQARGVLDDAESQEEISSGAVEADAHGVYAIHLTREIVGEHVEIADHGRHDRVAHFEMPAEFSAADLARHVDLTRTEVEEDASVGGVEGVGGVRSRDETTGVIAFDQRKPVRHHHDQPAVLLLEGRDLDLLGELADLGVAAVAQVVGGCDRVLADDGVVQLGDLARESVDRIEHGARRTVGLVHQMAQVRVHRVEGVHQRLRRRAQRIALDRRSRSRGARDVVEGVVELRELDAETVVLLLVEEFFDATHRARLDVE